MGPWDEVSATTPQRETLAPSIALVLTGALLPFPGGSRLASGDDTPQFPRLTANGHGIR